MANKLITITDEEREQLKKANAKYKSGLTLEPVGGVRALARIPDEEPKASNLDVVKHSGASVGNDIGSALKQTMQAMLQGSFADTAEYNAARTGNDMWLKQDTTKNDALADYWAQQRLETAKKAGERQAVIDQQYNAQKFSGGQQLANESLRAIGQVAPAIIPGVGTPYLLGLGFGAGTNQALNEGASLEDASDYGALEAMKEAAIEKTFGGLPFMKTLINPAKVTGKIGNKAVRTAADLAVRAAGEGVEEGVSAALSPQLQRMTYNPNAENATWDEIMHNAMIGAIASGAINVGVTGAQNIPKALPDAQKVQQKDQNRAFEALHGQKMEQKNADASQNVENALGQKIVDTAIKNTLNGNKASQNQSSQAVFVKNTIENVLNQKPVQNAPKMDPTISEMETVGAKNAQAGYETKPNDEESSNVGYEDYDLSQLSEEVHDFYEQIGELGEKASFKVRIVKNLDNNANGMYDGHGNILISADAAGSIESIRKVASHEIYHHMKNTDEHKQLQDLAFELAKLETPNLTQEQLVQNKIDDYFRLSEGKVQLDNEAAWDEVGAELVDRMLTDKKLAEQIWTKMPSLAERIVRALNDMLQRFKNRKLSPMQRQEAELLRQARDTYIEGLRSMKYADRTSETGERYMFAGERSGTADREALARAKQMESDGADMESIRQATGWFKSKVTGNKWAYEIDDSNADYTFMGDLNRLKNDPEYAEYMQMENNLSSLDFDANPELEKRYEYLFRKFAGTGRSNRGKASDFVSHDELFEAYPQLADMGWYQKDMNDINGAYHRSISALHLPSYITVSKYADNPLRTSLHEMQHAIQDIEGFPGGSSQSYWSDELEKQKREVEPLQQRLDFYYEEIGLSDFIRSQVPRIKDGELTMEQYWNELEAFKRNSDYGYAITMLEDEIKEYRNDGILGRTPQKLYENTAGEIMARDTASRNYLNDERRKQQQPKMGDENTVYADGWSSYSLDSDLSDKRSIIEKLQENTEAINNHGIVSRVYGRFAGEKDTKQIRKEAKTMFDELNNGVYRKGFGRVTLNKKGIKDSLSHGTGELKNIAFEAIPDVIRGGVEIDFQPNWKGKGYDTRIFAGVILVDGELLQMGVVVRSGDDYNKYYLHEVYIGGKKNKASSTKPGSGSTGDQLYPRGTNLSLDSIIQENSQKVNDGVRYSLPSDKAYLDAVNRGDMETAQRMVDEAAKNAGYSERLYHQTGSVFSSFNTDNQASGKYDYIMPTGIFLKPDDRDIGLRGKLQMGLYANIKNPLKFRDRTEMQNYWFENLPNYKNLFRQIEENDVEYKNRIDIAMDKMRQSRQDFFDGKITAEDRTRIREEANAESDRLFAEWREANNELSLQMKGMIDNYMGSLDFDSVIVENDEGAFGRSTKAYIVFNPNQLKSADVATYDNEVNIVPLSQRFNTGNSDIRYSLPNLEHKEQQFSIIQNSNPMLDDYHTGIRSADDILTFEEAIQENIFTPDYTEQAAQNALRKGKITVYSSYPISQGVFVTPSKMEAQLYAGGDGERVYSKTVSLNDVAWIDSLEGQYAKVDNEKMRYSMDTVGSQEYKDLLDEHGSIPKGENPTGENYRVEVPNKAMDGKKVRQFVRTIMEAPSINDAVANMFAQELIDPEQILSGVLTMESTSNKARVDAANESISDKGWEQEYQDLHSRIITGDKITAQDIALATRVVQEAQKAGDAHAAFDLLTDLTVVSSELGQALQAVQILKRLSPEGQLMALMKTQKRINDNLRKRRRKPVKPMSEETAAEFLQARSIKKRDEIWNREITRMAHETQGTWADKLNAIRYACMLSNPKTHIRNIIGNFVMQAAYVPRNIISGGLQDIKGGEKTHSFVGTFKNTTGNTRKELREFANYDYHKEAEQVLRNIGNRYDDVSGQFESQQKVFGDSLVGRGLEQVAGKGKCSVGSVLDAEDMAFKQLTYQNALIGYMKANGISVQDALSGVKKPNGASIAKGREYAVEQARKATFTEDNIVADWLSKGERKFGVAGTIAIGSVMPFKKTPLNILSRGVEFSPVGAGMTAYKLYHAFSGKETRSGKTYDINDVMDSLGANATGSIIMALGAYMAYEGLLVATGDDEEDRKARYDQQMGDQNFAVVNPLTGESWTIDWLAPSAMPLLTGVEVYRQLFGEGAEVDGNTLNKVLESASKIADPVFEMSCMQGVASALASYSGDTGDIASSLMSNFATGIGGQYVPQPMAAIARTIDDTVRSSYAPKDSDVILGKTMESFLRQQRSKVPVMSQQNEPSIDVWGNERKREFAGNETEQVIKRAMNNLLNPTTYSTDKRTELDRELEQLYKLTGNAGVLPKTDTNYVEVGGKTYHKTSEEKTAYDTTKGQKAKKYVSDFVKSSAYKSMRNADKAEIISDLHLLAGYEAKKQMLKKRDVWKDEYENAKYENVLKSRTSPAVYYAVDGKLNELNADKDKNGKSISGSRQDKVVAYLNAEKKAGRITDEQWWYFYTKEYSSQAKNAPYSWIREANK